MTKTIGVFVEIYHTELLNCVFEIINNYFNYNIILYNENDIYKNVCLLEKDYKFDKRFSMTNNNFLNDYKNNKCDKYIVLSHTDNLINGLSKYKDIIFVIHGKYEYDILHKINPLPLYTNLSKNIGKLTEQIFPITRRNNNNIKFENEKNLNVIVLGSIKNDEIINKNIIVHSFRMGQQNNVDDNNIYFNKSTSFIYEYINRKKIKYILYNPDKEIEAYSGCITFALDNNMILITNKQVVEIYNIPETHYILYKDENLLNKMKEKEMVELNSIYKENIYNNNCKIFKELFLIEQDITLLIQGKLHKNCLKGINENYSNITKNIIVSHWNNDDPKLIKELHYIKKNNHNINLTIIKNEMHIDANVFNIDNVYYQVYTTLEGLKKVKTKNVIKVRSDNWYGNLNFFIKEIKDDKYNCLNMHFRQDSRYKYHPSDILIGSNTNDLLNTFKIAYQRITQNGLILLSGAYMYTDDQTLFTRKHFDKYITHERPNLVFTTTYPEKPILQTIQILPDSGYGITPEQLIGTSYLLAKRILPIPEDSINIMKNNFNIINIDNILPYINKFGDDRIIHTLFEINNINELKN